MWFVAALSFSLFIFMQDCGSQIHPEESCGLQPLSHEYLSAISQTALKTCEAGDAKGLCLVFSSHALHQDRCRKRCFLLSLHMHQTTHNSYN